MLNPVDHLTYTILLCDDMEAMKAFREAGVDAAMVEDHVPRLDEGDAQYLSRAYALGYIRALLDAVKRGH